MTWLFRVGDVTAMTATLLYALALAVRYATHGIRNLQLTLIEARCATGNSSL
jgi:glycine betaine/proline transport system permease protein